MKTHNEQTYIELVNKVINAGYPSPSRAGDTLSLPGQQVTFDLRLGFPILTTRKIFTQGIWGELAAFVRGAEDLATFKQFGCNYWDENAANWAPNKNKPKEQWQIGKSYGSLWRNFNGVDQLANVIQAICTDHYSRRHVVSAWDPAAQACLPSCHIMFQLYMRQGYLHCHVYMRSVDLCVGLPSDVILYATLLSLIAKDTSLIPATLTFSFGDAHIYKTHLDQWWEQLSRSIFDAPVLCVTRSASTLTFTPDDVWLEGYEHHPAIKYQFMA